MSKKVPTLKPMLASTCEDVSKLRYPVFASPKFDGVRALIVNGELVSRSFKPIPNRWLQSFLRHLPEGTDGELIEGNPAQDPYRRTVSAVMSQNGRPDGVKLHCFDNFIFGGGFSKRFTQISRYVEDSDRAVMVEHRLISTVEELQEYEAECLTLGYEGTMVRDPDGPYKFGRSTEKEGFLLKIKQFVDSEAEILDTYEQMHNENEAEKDAFGRTERSTKQDGLVPAGVLGGFEVRDIKTGVEFRIGGGFTAEDREKLWKQRKSLIGKLAKYKYFPTGSKERPRFPVFLGFRDKADL